MFHHRTTSLCLLVLSSVTLNACLFSNPTSTPAPTSTSIPTSTPTSASSVSPPPELSQPSPAPPPSESPPKPLPESPQTLVGIKATDKNYLPGTLRDLHGTVSDKRDADAVYMQADNSHILSEDFKKVDLYGRSFEFTLAGDSHFSMTDDPCKQLFSMYRFPRETREVSVDGDSCGKPSSMSGGELVNIIDFFDEFSKDFYEVKGDRLDLKFPADLGDGADIYDFKLKVEFNKDEKKYNLLLGYNKAIPEYLRGLIYLLESDGCNYYSLSLLDEDMNLPEDIVCITLQLKDDGSELKALTSSFRSFVASVDSALPSLSQRLESLVPSVAPRQSHFLTPRLSLSIQRGVTTPYLATLANVTSSRFVYRVAPDSYVAWTSSYLARAESRASTYAPPRLTRVTYAPSRNLTLRVGMLREKSAMLGVANHNAIEDSETSFATMQTRFDLSRNVAVNLSATVGKTSLAMVESSFRDVALLSSAFQLRVRFRHTRHTHSDTETSLVLDQPRYIERASFTHKGQSVAVAQNRRPFSVRIEHGFRLAAGLRVAGVLSHYGSRDPLSLLVSLHGSY